MLTLINTYAMLYFGLIIFLFFNLFYMAHKKAAGSTALGRESASKRLGIKIQDGEYAKAGAILVRQRGTIYHPGANVKRGGDDTLFATTPGKVKFIKKKLRKYNNQLQTTTIVNVMS